MILHFLCIVLLQTQLLYSMNPLQRLDQLDAPITELLPHPNPPAIVNPLLPPQPPSPKKNLDRQAQDAYNILLRIDENITNVTTQDPQKLSLYDANEFYKELNTLQNYIQDQSTLFTKYQYEINNLQHNLLTKIKSLRPKFHKLILEKKLEEVKRHVQSITTLTTNITINADIGLSQEYLKQLNNLQQQLKPIYREMIQLPKPDLSFSQLYTNVQQKLNTEISRLYNLILSSVNWHMDYHQLQYRQYNTQTPFENILTLQRILINLRSSCELLASITLPTQTKQELENKQQITLHNIEDLQQQSHTLFTTALTNIKNNIQKIESHPENFWHQQSLQFLESTIKNINTQQQSMYTAITDPLNPKDKQEITKIIDKIKTLKNNLLLLWIKRIPETENIIDNIRISYRSKDIAILKQYDNQLQNISKILFMLKQNSAIKPSEINPLETTLNDTRANLKKAIQQAENQEPIAVEDIE